MLHDLCKKKPARVTFYNYTYGSAVCLDVLEDVVLLEDNWS